jgi:hypothetical protein
VGDEYSMLALDIGLTILQLAVGAAIGVSYRWIRTQVLTRRPALRIWSIDKSLPVHIITAQDDSDFSSEFTVKVYPAEYLAAVEVRSLLSDTIRHSDVNLLTSNEFRMGPFLHHNLVCIGGPVHNRVSRVLLERLTIPVTFDEYTVVSGVTSKRYSAVIDPASGKITRDVGVLVLDQNPFQESSLAALLMGARTFGCPASSRVLTSGLLKRMETILGQSGQRWAILDVDVVDEFVARVNVLESSGSIEPS